MYQVSTKSTFTLKFYYFTE